MTRHIAAGSLDGRTWIAKALKDIRDDLAADRGGLDRCSAAERILIDRAAARSVIVQSIEHWVFSQDGVVTPTGELLSVLRKGYATHAANLARILVALGLHADRDKGPDLATYLRERSAATADVVAAEEPQP